MIQAVQREPRFSRQAKVIDGQSRELLESFLVLRRWTTGSCSDSVDAVRDEEDEVDEETVGGS
jgi:hypothetical protein